MPKFRAALCLLTVVCLLAAPAMAITQSEKTLFEEATAALLSPKEAAMQSGTYTLRTGESAYVPAVAPEITPFDKAQPGPLSDGAVFETTDDSIVAVDANGLMTGVSEGVATVICTIGEDTYIYGITVAAEAMPEQVKAFLYVVKREYYQNQREWMARSNQYTKWYYKSSKAVGWCSVFTIWCANAAGFDPIPDDDAKEITDDQVLFVREGQVGNQYDAFSYLNRFVGVPRPGYMVIYANRKNEYLFTHIGIVTDVADLGDGRYLISTVEGNMSSTVKHYTYIYDSNFDNHLLTSDTRSKVQANMFAVPEDQQTDPLTQYETTENFTVFGFCATWL
ncbi:MAG: CHAP domain-containing protein [Eubacteriales bacterium]|nr:CHAP domain-containing protein [Eubacteriales bacterium]